VRAGFTLVEMLVATALVMFIMLILSEAFVADWKPSGLERHRRHGIPAKGRRDSHPR